MTSKEFRHHAYSSKAEKYARYRWDYAPEALRVIFEMIGSPSIVADLGAGTGILMKHFAGRARYALAIEPNLEMCAQAAYTLRPYPACSVIAGAAEAIPLPGASIDLITVAQAIHWFEPEPARREMRRILKPGGWLAVLRNYGTDEAQGKAQAELSRAEYGVIVDIANKRPEQKPLEFFFGHNAYQHLVFPFSYYQDWPAFIGALLSASYMPDEDHPLYPRLEHAARQAFERLSKDGRLEVRGETELCIGQCKIGS